MQKASAAAEAIVYFAALIIARPIPQHTITVAAKYARKIRILK